MDRLVSISIPTPINEIDNTKREIRKLIPDDLADKIEIKEISKITKFAPKEKSTTVIRINFTSKLYKESNFLDFLQKLKSAYPNSKIRVQLEQLGGGYSNTGNAIVVSLLDGTCPEKVVGIHKCRSSHAIYWVKEAYEIRINYWNKDNPPYSGEIRRITVSFKNFVDKPVAKMYGNSPDDFEVEILEKDARRNLEKIRNAIVTAMKKATCYHCREEHRW